MQRQYVLHHSQALYSTHFRVIISRGLSASGFLLLERFILTTWLMCCLPGLSVGCLTLVDWNRNPRSLSVFPRRCSWLFLSHNILREKLCAWLLRLLFHFCRQNPLQKQIMTRRIYPGLSFKKTLSLAARRTVRAVGGSLQAGLSFTFLFSLHGSIHIQGGASLLWSPPRQAQWCVS